LIAGSAAAVTKPRKPSACSPTMPADLAASTVALVWADWATAATGRARAAARPRAKRVLVCMLMSSEEVRVLLDQGLHVLVQAEAGVQGQVHPGSGGQRQRLVQELAPDQVEEREPDLLQLWRVVAAHDVRHDAEAAVVAAVDLGVQPVEGEVLHGLVGEVGE